MTRNRALVSLAAVVAVAAAAYGAYWVGMDRGMQMASPAAASAQASGKKVLYWHDPMVPGQKFDKPGKSPFMDMMLVPVYAGDEQDEGKVSISARVQQNLGVRLAEAIRAPLARSVEVVGSVAYNERELHLVQARANGYVERLYVRAPLDRVAKDAPLAELLVPDWVAAQEEFLAVVRMSDPGLGNLREGARQRMRLAGMTDEQIRAVETSGRVQPRMTLVSPISGVVSELAAREGMTVMNGAALFRINGLATVWVNAEIPENLAAAIRPGNSIQARAAAFPGEAFKGTVGAILPEVNAATRTLKARIELANPNGQLVPGMFVTVDLLPQARDAVVQVPSEAVIQTGKRTVVLIAEPAKDGKQRFKPVDVEIGAESNGMTEIRKGVDAGTQVVASGQFLIDSEASLKATTSRMEGAQPASQGAYRASGTVEKVDKEAVTISHGPVPSLQWGSMTMEFGNPPGGVPQSVRVGSRVDFEFAQGASGSFVLKSIAPSSGAAPGAPK